MASATGGGFPESRGRVDSRHLASAPPPRAPASRALAAEGRSVFGEVIALRRVGAACRQPHLSLAQAEPVARAFRGALLRHATDPPPAALSGHEPGGRRLERPHAAFLALPSPDLGAVAGVAIALPRDIEDGNRQAILLAAARWELGGARLLLGRFGAMRLARLRDSDVGEALPLTDLTSGSRHWASLTPVALPRNPGPLAAPDPARAACARRAAEQTVADACSHSGLPRPTEVRVLRRSPFPAVPPAAAFAPYPRVGSGLKRVCVHVELHFAEPVAGPVLIGVGRYFGVGVCAPCSA